MISLEQIIVEKLSLILKKKWVTRMKRKKKIKGLISVCRRNGNNSTVRNHN